MATLQEGMMKLQDPRPTIWGASGARLAIVLFIAAYLTAGFYTEVRLIERQPTPPPLLDDFRHYERALSDALSGIGAYTIREIGPGYLYPPPSLFLIEAFHLVPEFAWRVAAYWTLNVGLLVFIVLSLARRFGGTPAQQAYWATLALPFAPFLELLHIGQINIITLFGVALVFLYQNRSAVLSGFGLALAALTKLSPLVLIAYLVACRQLKPILFGFGLIVVASLLSALRYDASLTLRFGQEFG